MKGYQKLGKPMIHELILKEGQTAYDIAREFYTRYSNMDFADDLIEYSKKGWVHISPTSFALAKIIDLNKGQGDKKPAWFIQFAVGSMAELLLALYATSVKLGWICFCRRNDDNMRVIEFDKFVRRVGAIYGFKGS